MQAIIQSLATNYERIGKGKQVLVLHGWADNSLNWSAFAQGLARHYEVIIPDLPGFGGTEPPQSVWGLAEYAEFAAVFIAKLKINPYAVIAHSNGGAIAIKGISNGTLHPSKLILLASAGIRDEGRSRKRAWRYVAKTGKVVASPLPSSVQNKLRKKLYRAAGSDMLVAEHLEETFKKVVCEDVREDSCKVTIPTLLVYGGNDTSTPPRYGELFAQTIPNAILEIVPGTGHFIYADAQEATTLLVEGFLR